MLVSSVEAQLIVTVENLGSYWYSAWFIDERRVWNGRCSIIKFDALDRNWFSDSDRLIVSRLRCESHMSQDWKMFVTLDHWTVRDAILRLSGIKVLDKGS